MIDARRLRTDLEATKAALARKKVPAEEVERAAGLDTRHRQLSGMAEDLRSRIKTLSKQVGDAMRAGDTARADTVRDKASASGRSWP